MCCRVGMDPGSGVLLVEQELPPSAVDPEGSGVSARQLRKH